MSSVLEQLVELFLVLLLCNEMLPFPFKRLQLFRPSSPIVLFSICGRQPDWQRHFPGCEYKVTPYIICNVFGEGQIFITFTAGEFLSNNYLVNLETALIFVLKFPTC